VLTKPRGGRTEWEGRVVNMRRRVSDYIKVFQEETLAVIYPLAGNICLKKYEYGLPE